MKKIMNLSKNYVLDMLQGLEKSVKHLKLLKDSLVIYDCNHNKKKVNLVSGGGAGHEPAHGGFVGEGMLTAAVSGHIFTSPTPDQITTAIKTLDAEETLLIIKNYTGDVMNFKIAAQLAEADGKKVDYIVIDDDVAVQNSTWTEGRRGVAGTIFVHKVAGAAAASNLSLSEVKAIAEKAKKNIRTIGVSLEACISPITGEPSFELDDNEYEFRIGIHGEPGIEKTKLVSSKELVVRMLNKILVDRDFHNKEVIVQVNGMGGTPLSELYIATNDALDYLAIKGIKVYDTRVDNLMTSLDMKGFSITLFAVDAQLKEFYDAKTNAIAWR